MAKLGRAGFPVPSGYVQLVEAVMSIVGPPPSLGGSPEEMPGAYYRNVASLWGDIWVDLLSGDMTSHGVVPGSGFGPLPASAWAGRQFEYPPGVVPLNGASVEPLIRQDEVLRLAALWASNPLSGEPSQESAASTGDGAGEKHSDVAGDAEEARSALPDEQVSEALPETVIPPSAGRRKRGVPSMAEEDKPAITEMARLLAAKEARSVHQAAGIVLATLKVGGYGTDDARIRRLSRRFREKNPAA